MNENYEYWLDDLIAIEKFLEKKDSIKSFRLNAIYWNRFNKYYKLLTKRPSDLLHAFFDAFLHNKDFFCDTWNNHLRYKKDHSAKYYFQEKYYIDKACDCVFLSYNKSLIRQLDTIRMRDQKFRGNTITDSKKQKVLDSLNLVSLEEIMKEHGYPNRTMVGVQYQSHLFYVIQHSNLPTMKKYLPLIKGQVESNMTASHLYPLLYDRIQLLEGNPQKFGTQSIFKESGNKQIYKLENKELVNEFRSEYGLQPLKKSP